jgi:hypothetical protein
MNEYAHQDYSVLGYGRNVYETHTHTHTHTHVHVKKPPVLAHVFIFFFI